MKFKISNTAIPHNSRKEINDKILYLISNGIAEESGITPEDIFNAYTGDGGLHNLKVEDFRNYHEYSNAKKEIENGQFFTPHHLCRLVMDALSPADDETVADLTSGMGNFCNYMPIEGNFFGCELDAKAHKVASYLYPAANFELADIRRYNPSMRFDYIVGNPPFNLKWQTENGECLSQLYYCLKAAELLKPLGIMAVIVPASFLSDDFTDGKIISELENHFSFLGQATIPASAFSALGVTSYDTKLMFWQKHLEQPEEHISSYRLGADFVIPSVTDDCAAELSELFVAEARERMRKNRARAKLVLAGSENSDFVYRVRKMLYQIKTNPKTKEKYSKCMEYIYRFENQKQPDGMKYEDWLKHRITEAKVIAYLKRALASQSAPASRDEVRYIKRGHSFVYKPYSTKVRRTMQDWQLVPVSINDIVTDQAEAYLPENYTALIRRKQREREIETTPFSEMKTDEKISAWLSEFSVFDSENEEEIRLNEIQRNDINLLLQKRYTLLQWEQGSGKTLAGIAAGLYRMTEQNACNAWVVSTAISINNNWDSVLESYGLPYRMIKSLADLESIQRGEFVIITLNMLCKYRKQIKNHIKSKGQKICLVFDESDEMTNPNSKRTKAVLDCFRRVKYKLLMTGTSTRNNISEIAPQLELMYNNSVNLLSLCSAVYSIEKNNEGENTLAVDSNDYYGKPFPAYKKGYSLFSASHLPRRITVFGVGKDSQDIYNADELEEILSYSVITRTFEEVTGKDIRRIHQEVCEFSEAEREVYRKAIKEFYSLRFNYFASTGNSRKDSMMALIQQITLLLRISAAPNTVAEYNSTDMPVKIACVMSMLSRWHDEPVVIGVRHKVVVEAYEAEIRRLFPDRPLFVVTGSTTTLAKRKALRKTLKASGNGILLCTQQALPSSVNFEFVNKIIIPELHYNNARMSQFYHRFIRYTSTDWKDIYFVTYAGSIESNQMQMVLAKEKLNMFMKGKDADLDEVYERFGVDYDLLSLLMNREKDKDGHFHISWGEQKIS